MKTRFLTLILCLVGSIVYTQIGFYEHDVLNNSLVSDVGEALYTVDMDGDGDLDVLSCAYSSSRIVWYENYDGAGLFRIREHVITEAVNAPRMLHYADFDGDGDPDVVSGSWLDDNIMWFENVDGLGNFGEPNVISTNIVAPNAIYAADFDGDGDPDLVTVSFEEEELYWIENLDGLGSFGPLQLFSINVFQPTAIHVADLDNDGDMDIMASTQEDDLIRWHENTDGQGSFQLNIISTSADFASDVYAADIDGDGDLDALSASQNDNKIAWYENLDGEGSFGIQRIISTEVDYAAAVYPADVDGDGDLDVFSAANISGNLTWHENLDGDGNFGPPQVFNSNTSTRMALVAADMDLDGDIDLIGNDGEMINWFENTDGLGTFINKYNVMTRAKGLTDVNAVDLDGDGDLDLLTSSANDDKIAWYENTTGEGDFPVQRVIARDALNTRSVCAADLDGDNDIDVLAVASQANKIVWYENTDGQADFASEQIIDTDTQFPRIVLAADVDADGDSDVLVGNSLGVGWHENTNGQGAFAARQMISSDFRAVDDMQAVDLDNDGDLDVLSTAQFITDAIVWNENLDGQGNFGPDQVITMLVDEPRSVYAADLDADGDLDVVSASEGDDTIAWYEHLDGQGSFGTQQIITTESNGSRSIYCSDMDGDGDQDLISSAIYNDESLLWYENIDGQGAFNEGVVVSAEPYNLANTGAVLAADIDGDTDLDIVSVSNRLSWHENLGVLGNTISGALYFDADSNGCDLADLPVIGQMVNSVNGNNTFSTFTSTNGTYLLNMNEGEFTTSVTAAFPPYFEITPSEYTSSFVGIGTIDTADFCLEFSQQVNDLNITLIPTSEARAGFQVSYQLVYQNLGTSPLDVVISLVYNQTQLSFLSASETPSSQGVNELTFEYTALQPFESRQIALTFDIFPPPIVDINDELDFTASITPVVGDYTEADNIFSFSQLVIGSYDPNDITVLEGDQIAYADIDEYLHYVIRFQNTGTASAITVRVNTLLDELLDWPTLQIQSASHNYRTELKDGRELDFIFNNINLPDSTSNEAESHGYVAYKIKPRPDVSIGDIIAAQAGIFFDFNPPIITNTATTEIVEMVSVSTLAPELFKLYPNPATGLVHIDSSVEVSRIEVYSQLGDLLLANDQQLSVQLSELPTGFYFLKILDREGNFVVKKVVKR